MKKGVWFGLSIMAMVVVATFAMLPPVAQITNGHLGLLMLSLIVVAIMLGFPTAFTLMGMGMIFTWLFYREHSPALAMQQTLDLMVQRAYGVMGNDVLISIPLFVFMGYLVERANLIEKLFKSLHLAMARVPIRVEQDPARLRASDVPSARIDATKLRERTGWRPRHALRDTVATVLDDCRRCHGA